jgi:Zn-dependent protease
VTAYRDYDNSPLMQLLRFVTLSFGIGDFFGVHVRMYWAAAIGMPLLFWYWTAGFVDPNSNEPLFTAGETLLIVAIWFFGLFTIIWSHEMGHIACGWRFRIRTDVITLSPLGGVAHMNAPASTPRTELLIALAGPAVHLIWLAVFWPLDLLLPNKVLHIDGWRVCPITFTVGYLVRANTWLMLFNLLPFFPLDGGRTLRALLAMRWHPNLATMWATMIGMIGGGLFIVLGLMRQDVYHRAIWVTLGISCISSCLNERRLARHVLVYQQAMQDPWATDPDAWKRGAGPLAPPRRGHFFARWRRARAERKAQRAAAAAAALDREVDQILERVHQVGMSGLTDREKAVLKRASQRRRGAG